MEYIFLDFLNRSIQAGWLILAVIVLRFLLKKAPKWIRLFFWALVGIRLLCPFSLQSAFSLIPSEETVSPEIFYAQEPVIESGIEIVNQAVNPVLTEAVTLAQGAGKNPIQAVTWAAGWLWSVGLIGMLLYGCISYLQLRKRVAQAVPLWGNVKESEQISSPFVLGVFRTYIYLPMHLENRVAAQVIAHEKEHIRRKDHWTKIAGYLLLSVYWFQPLVWAAYVLLCKDIEMACDEAVIRKMNVEERKMYSKALLSCSELHHRVAVCPLAFGEVSVKQRIQSVLYYKKPAFWLAVAAAVAGIAAAVCFLTVPKGKQELLTRWDGVYTTGRVLAQVPELSSLGNGGLFEQIIIRNRGLVIIGPDGETLYDVHQEGGSSVTGYSNEAFRDFLNNSGMIGVENIELPSYKKIEDIQVYSYYHDENQKEAAFRVFYFKGQPCWIGEGDNKRLYELVPNTKDLQYGPAEASRDNCVVFTDLSVTAGQKVWKNFLKKTEKGQAAMVRFAYYYTEEQVMYLADLRFDGENYRYDQYENGEVMKSRDYKYLQRIEGKEEDDSSLVDKYVYYVLVNEKDVVSSREDIMKVFASSTLAVGSQRFEVVYRDNTYKK